MARFDSNWNCHWISKDDIEKAVMADERTAAQIGDKQVRKMIVVPLPYYQYCHWLIRQE